MELLVDMSVISEEERRDLTTRAREGRLSSAELESLVERLGSANADSRYSLLRIIGLAGDLQFRRIVEAYLDWPDDPALSRLALQIVCKYWGLSGEYLLEITRFLGRVSWDKNEEVRSMAVSCAADYLKEHHSLPLWRALIAIIENVDEDADLRAWAVHSVGRALGYSWAMTESFTGELNEQRLRLVLANAKSRATGAVG